MKKHYTVVGFLAGRHGLNGLAHLIDSGVYSPVCIFTHRLRPRSESPHRSQREEFAEYEALCKSHKIPFYAIDSEKEAMKIAAIVKEHGEFDFIVSISWRRLIEASLLGMPTIGGLNLHRGKLPEYAGAEPIRRALENGNNFIQVTSHILAEEIDSGETIAEYKHPVHYNKSYSLTENIERLKRELTPHFGPLLIQSLRLMADTYENK